MYFTGAIKNQFGMIPGLLKSSLHMKFPARSDFAAMIVDLHQALKPDFAFMDGIISMEGPGPGNGFAKKTQSLPGKGSLFTISLPADTTASDPENNNHDRGEKP